MGSHHCTWCAWKEGSEGDNHCWRCFGATSLQGLPQFADGGRSSGVRWAWCTMAIVGLVVSIVGSVSLVNSYLDFDTQTSVEFIDRAAVLFPSITICPLSWNATKVAQIDSLQFLLNRTGVDIRISDFANLTQSQLDTISFSQRETLISCLFEGTPCTRESDLQRKYYGPIYGYCYTVNPNGTFVDAGFGSLLRGMQLILNTNQDAYLPYIRTAGFRIAIHDPNTLPDFQEDFIIGAATSTTVSLSPVLISSPPHPYRECQPIETAKPSPSEYELVRSNCARECNRDKLMERCGCLPLGLLVYFPLLPSCLTATQNDCLNSYSAELVDLGPNFLTTFCKCSLSLCTITRYVKTFNSVPFPRLEYAKAFGPITGIDPNVIVRDFSELSVTFESYSTTAFIASPATTLTQTVSDIGGLIGLFLGATLLTLFELVELALLVVPRRWRKKLWLHRTAFETKAEAFREEQLRAQRKAQRLNSESDQNSSSVQLSNLSQNVFAPMSTDA